MVFQKNHDFGGRKKGMAEYRALLTKKAYEADPSKCLRVILNIIKDAENGDPVCRKIFAQSYMTKAPAEVHVTKTIDNNPFTENESYEAMRSQAIRLFGEEKAIPMIEGMIELSQALKEQDTVSPSEDATDA